MDSQTRICKYVDSYYDLFTGSAEVYHCDRECIASGPYCAFHDDYYWDANRDEVSSMLEDELRNGSKSPKFFIGCNFHKIDLSGINPEGPIYFTYAKFHEDVTFSNMIFESVDFSDAELHGDFIMQVVSIRDRLVFKKARFSIGAQMSIHAGAKFTLCSLNSPTFTATVFKRLSFEDCTLTNADFSRSEFTDDLLVKDTSFKNLTRFYACKFSYGCRLIRCTAADADFSNTEFEQLTVGESTFNNMAKFHSCRFRDRCSFAECTIAQADFSSTHFYMGLHIRECGFKSMTKFYACEFPAGCNFSDSVFDGAVNFKNAAFKAVSAFHGIDFTKHHLVAFDDDLSRVSFLGTDITRVSFGKNVDWGGDDRYTVLDQRNLVEHPELSNLSDVLSVYRDLRDNYEFRMKYDEAGRFFIKEMDLKRLYYQDHEKGVKTRRIARYLGLKCAYKMLSNYGERMSLLVPWAAFFVFGVFVYFYLCPDIGYEVRSCACSDTKPCMDLTTYDIGALDHAQSLCKIDYASKLSGDPIFRAEASAYRTLDSFLQLTSTKPIDSVVRAVSLFMLGMAYICMRRKLERRFRH